MRLSAIGVLLLFFQYSYAQPGKLGNGSITTTNQIINRYAALNANAPKGTTQVIIQDITMLSPVVAGDMILIYQAQGAAIKTDNSIDYGEITNYNEAGNYEFAYISAIVGNTITLKCPLKASFLGVGDFKAQVVYVPLYDNLTIGVGSSVTSSPWDGKVGGVVALHVNRNLILNGNIDVSTQGFRGGIWHNSVMQLNTDFVTNDLDKAAEKGEGIAGSAINYSNMGGQYGKGAPANGGGGGDEHNCGGGGGANGDNGKAYTGAGVMCTTCVGAEAWKLDPAYIVDGKFSESSGGGRGGYSLSTSDQDATILAPGEQTWSITTTLYPWEYRLVDGGMGGRPLVLSPETKLFFGGGGGAGDANNDNPTSGGNGGGLIFIIADTIQGTGQIISNGAAALDVNSNFLPSDGPGGGGAGGSILLKAKLIEVTVIEASGGKGGNQINTYNNTEAEGPGGGGSGGVVVFAGCTAAKVNGGASGLTSSSSLTEFPANGGTNGATGVISRISNSFISFTDCKPTTGKKNPVSFCSGDTASMGLLPKINLNRSWSPVTGIISPLSSMTLVTLKNSNTIVDTLIYELTTLHTDINCIDKDTFLVAVYPLPKSIDAEIKNCGGIDSLIGKDSLAFHTYEWTSIPQFAQPTYSLQHIKYSNVTAIPDTVYLQRKITNIYQCLASDSLTIITYPVPIANAGADTNICLGKSVTLLSQVATQYLWSTGDITQSTKITPTANSSISLQVKNIYGCQSLPDIVMISVSPSPIAKFEKRNYEICFDDSVLVLQGGQALYYTWEPNGESSPSISVQKGGTYKVTLSNGTTCSSSDSVVVAEYCDPIFAIPKSFSPNDDGYNDSLQVFGKHFTNFKIIIFNRWGEIVFESTNRYYSWDGNYRGLPMPLGVYPWVIQYDSEKKRDILNPRKLNGSITLIR